MPVPCDDRRPETIRDISFPCADGLRAMATSDDPPTTGSRADRILEAFGRRAGAHGIRAVVMSDLAGELGMSTKTLYREFATKDALVQALVRRWIDQLVAAQAERRRAGMGPEQRLQLGSREVLEWRRTNCEAFWDDLRADHPAAWALYLETVRAERVAAWVRVESEMREDVDHVLAWQLINVVVEHALTPEVRRKTGMGVGEAIDAAVTIWARGALRPPHRGDRGE
jgi:AcrR family transcriptional regulator